MLLYDHGPPRRRWDFRPADPSLKHAYRLRKDARSPSSLVTGRAFCRAHAIPTDRGRRYKATMQDGVLIIDLTDEPEIPRTRRGRAGDPRLDPRPHVSSRFSAAMNSGS